ncbi:TadE family protein [Nocardioides sp. Bht2]|uniref:TadE family protein n=1 Tax=Nocardioides sp. Bht2 TaxID=3392297 RepID=UPI0039B3CBCC
MRSARSEAEGGAAVVDFVLICVILMPLVLGIIQVAVVLHVRNTLTSAATEGARYAGRSDVGLEAGERYARERAEAVVADRFLHGVEARSLRLDGAEVIEVRITAEVPALGLFGPSVRLEVEGHGLKEPR